MRGLRGSEWPVDGSGSLSAKEGERLYDDNARELHSRALRALLASREQAVERFIEILQAQVAGNLALEERQGLEELRAMDAKAWSDTATELRALFERYAGRRGDALIQLSGEVGIPDKGRKPEGLASSPFRARQLARVEELRRSIGEMDADFDVEAAAVLSAYEAGRARSTASFNESVKRRANEEQAALAARARESVAFALETVDESFPIVDRTLGPLGASVIGAAPPKPVSPSIGGGGGSPALSGLEESAKLFVKSRGYVLRATQRGARNVTEEFQEWVMRQRVGLSGR